MSSCKIVRGGSSLVWVDFTKTVMKRSIPYPRCNWTPSRFCFTPEILILRESKDGKVGRPGLTGWLSHILTKGHGRGTGDVMDAGKV